MSGWCIGSGPVGIGGLRDEGSMVSGGFIWSDTAGFSRDTVTFFIAGRILLRSIFSPLVGKTTEVEHRHYA